jgi:propanol-preferring alcohol dehydrogenase
MKALRLLDWKSDPELVDVERPTPGPGQVLVRIGGAGACHSDLHLMHEFEGGVLPWGPPFTLGHENAGWIEEIGPESEASGLEAGTAVAVYGPWGCGQCAKCLAGVETYCEHPELAPIPGGGGGLGADGGMAEFMLVPSARQLVPLPDGLDPAHAAPLTDAALTPYHAVKRSWAKLPPNAWAVVIGVGGLGHMAVQILKATTAARVIAVDTRAEARSMALTMGADLALAPDDTAAEAIKSATGGLGADVVLDFVGLDATLALSAAVVRVLGDLTVVGIGGGSYPLSFFSIPYEASVQTTYWGSRPELAEVLLLAARGLITPKVRTFSLDEAPQVYKDLAAGKIDGRAVIVP